MNFFNNAIRSNKGIFIRRMYSNSNCNYKSPDYVFSPFSASLVVGSLYSIISKEHVSKELLYVKIQNEEIITRIKNLEKDSCTKNT